MIKNNETFIVALSDGETWDGDASAVLLCDKILRKEYELPEDKEIIKEIDDSICLQDTPDEAWKYNMSVKYLMEFYLTSKELGLNQIPEDIMRERMLAKMVAP